MHPLHLRKCSNLWTGSRPELPGLPLLCAEPGLLCRHVPIPPIDCFNEYVSYEAWENDQIISQGTVIFSYPKYFHYLDPNLTVRVEGDEIVVTADAYAKSVEIRNETEDLVLEDNYFDMNAGERRVKILDGKPEGLQVRSVYDI